MILLDVVDADNQKSDSSQLSASGAPLRTVRHPETYKRSPSSSSLPDYYESQAKEDTNPAAENIKKRFKTGRRFWRNVAIILLVYVVLSVVIAVAVYLTVRLSFLSVTHSLLKACSVETSKKFPTNFEVLHTS